MTFLELVVLVIVFAFCTNAVLLHRSYRTRHRRGCTTAEIIFCFAELFFTKNVISVSTQEENRADEILHELSTYGTV